MNKRLATLLIAMAAVWCGGSAFGQSATSLCINEVLANNQTGFQDDYGQKGAWIEIFNSSYATVDIRNCYLTNNKAVLNPDLTAPERAALMYPIPKGDTQTKIAPRQHLLFWADGEPKKGNFHTNFALDTIGPNWVALYDANAITLLDSIYVPALPADCSYALIEDGVRGANHPQQDFSKWTVMGLDGTYVTPSTNNKTLDTNEKVTGFKEKDKSGVGMTVMAMLVVFCGLLLLFIAFYIIGRTGFHVVKKNAMRSHGIESKQEAKEKGVGRDSGEVFAAIAMALHEYQGNVHDIEDTILTINKVKRNYSPWSSKIYTLRQLPHK